MPENREEEAVEVFRTTDRFTAQAAIDEVLGPAGINAVIHDRSSSMIPAPASMTGGFFVAVAASQARAAVEALRGAQSAGALSMEGAINDDLMA